MLWSISRRHIRLTASQEARIDGMLAALRQEGCPRGWRFEAAAEERQRRALINLGVFAA